MLLVSRRAAVAAGLAVLSCAALIANSGPQKVAAADPPQLAVLASYAADAEFDDTGAEIVAHDGDRMYVVNGGRGVIEVVDISNPSAPQYLFDVDLSEFGPDITSVAAHKGLLVAAVPAGIEASDERTQPGTAVFFDRDGNVIRAVTVGSLPDMVTFTPNGARVLVANEGEPNQSYTVDPEGTVSVIDVAQVARGNPARPLRASAVRTVSFEAFNEGGPRHDELPTDVRIFGPDATVAQDLEPEYITVSDNNRKAYVTLQENNAIAVIDVQSAAVDSIFALGFKDHSLPGNRLDASDRDPEGAPEFLLLNWPILGMYQPDGLASFRVGGETYLVTANEGDAREYLGAPGYVEAGRLRGLTGGGSMVAPLCADVFGSSDDIASLRDNANLGRLNITTANGIRTSGPGAPCFEEIYAFGARSFSIWSEDGELVYDSGEDFEVITNAVYGDLVNSNHTEDNEQGRSDDKGPEPEGVAIGKVGKHTYAFIGLERIGGVMVYDVTNPESPVFVQYINNRSLVAPANPAAGPDLGAEGLVFVDAKASPTGVPLLLVANEVSGTVTIFEFD